MLNEWRTNVWLVVELMIVVVVLQFVFGSLYSIYEMYRKAVDTDISDIYVAGVISLEEDNDGYVPYDSVHSAATDLEMLLLKLRSNPYVEIVGTGTSNATPYQYNFWGNFLTAAGDTAMTGFNVNIRGVSPEMLEIFEIQGANGETPSQLADIIRKGGIVISDPDVFYDRNSPRAADLAGKEVYIGGDSLTLYRVGAVSTGMRRNDYEPAFYGTCFMPVKSDEARVVAIRVKHGDGHKFIESLKDEDRQSGNLYMTSLLSLDDRREACQIEVSQAIRSVSICALFVMTMVLLGFLGTFWFRTQQRVPEIAVRKVNGATNRDIYARFFSEGLLLLAVAVILALPLSIWLIGNFSLITDVITVPGTIAIVAVMTVVAIALLIVAAIYAPARKAAHVSPAEALKDM